MNRRAESARTYAPSTCGNATQAICHSLCQNDAGFALVAKLWAALPQPIKADILAMVKLRDRS
jgi:hypothetical protein